MMDVVKLAILFDVLLFVILVLIGLWTCRRRSTADNSTLPGEE
jgi:FtsZ-interacting cell division protein ZipA